MRDLRLTRVNIDSDHSFSFYLCDDGTVSVYSFLLEIRQFMLGSTYRHTKEYTYSVVRARHKDRRLSSHFKTLFLCFPSYLS